MVLVRAERMSSAPSRVSSPSGPMSVEEQLTRHGQRMAQVGGGVTFKAVASLSRQNVKGKKAKGSSGRWNLVTHNASHNHALPSPDQYMVYRSGSFFQHCPSKLFGLCPPSAAHHQRTGEHRDNYSSHNSGTCHGTSAHRPRTSS